MKQGSAMVHEPCKGAFAVSAALTLGGNASFHNQRTEPIVKVVVTGFEPFPGVPINPSAELVQHLGQDSSEHLLVRRFLLPVSFHAAGWRIREIIDFEKPQLLLMFGVDATQRKYVRVETQAKNAWQSGPHHPVTRVHPSGAEEYVSPLPTDLLVRTLTRADIPAVISTSAGTHVCNYVFYSAAEHIQSRRYQTIFGFVHLPLLVTQPEPSQMVHQAERILKLVECFSVILRELVNEASVDFGQM
jgi:pyroglutamyl-peptidase